mgnify:CR=1 FL=1
MLWPPDFELTWQGVHRVVNCVWMLDQLAELPVAASLVEAPASLVAAGCGVVVFSSDEQALSDERESNVAMTMRCIRGLPGIAVP